MRRFLQNLFLPILDFVYPPICITCKSLLAREERQVCDACWGSFLRIDRDHPTWKEIESKILADGTIAALTSCFLFEKEGKLQEVIHLLKYAGMKSLGRRLGREIGVCLREQLNEPEIAFLTPVPLHPLKKRERGYNQAAILCSGIEDMTHIPQATSLLRRRKYTVSQTQLDLAARRENVRDAFMINLRDADRVKDVSFLLVDDVITTGSTLMACAKVLKDHGASCVRVASVALAQ